MRIYYCIASILILFGAVLNADLLWGIADVSMGAMALINIPVIVILSKYAFRALKDYECKIKMGKTLSFSAKDIDLPQKVDAWQD